MMQKVCEKISPFSFHALKVTLIQLQLFQKLLFYFQYTLIQADASNVILTL